MSFSSNIFINCPFDKDYSPLLKSLIFTVLYFDLEPKLSQTVSSSSIRINEIKKYIKICKYGIHDLSRCKALKKNELPRLNMPYELGLDIGCCEYGGKRFLQKRILILETDRYHYQKVISDIARQDIENHNDNPNVLVQKVRNWFSANNPNIIIPGHTEIWIAFNQFNADLLINLSPKYTQFDIEEMPIGDFVKFAKGWIKNFKVKTV